MSNSSSVSNGLEDSHELTESQFILSENKQYSAVMQSDGDFIVYQIIDSEHKKLSWSSGTAGKGHGGPYRAKLEDGTFSVLDGKGTELWTTHIKEKERGPHTLVMDNDGHLRIYDHGKKNFIWCNHCLFTQYKLEQNNKMNTPGFIVSQNNSYYVAMKAYSDSVQYDSLIEYRFGQGNNRSQYLFDSSTQTSDTSCYLLLNSSAELGIYTSAGERIQYWAPIPPVNMTNIIGPYYLQINNDSSLSVYGKDSTNTAQVVYTLHPAPTAPSS